MLRPIYILIICLNIFANFAYAQDAQELEAERQASAKLKGKHPLIALAESKPSTLRKELEGVHPRVFMTQPEIDV